MARRIKGVAVKGINLGDVKFLPIPCPPPSKQNEFGRVFNSLTAIRSQQREAIRQADQLFDTLLHRAFRGEL